MSDIVSFDDLDAQFSSIGLEKASIDTIKKIHKVIQTQMFLASI